MGGRMLKADQFADDKILCHPENISEWYHTGDTSPVTYELDVTNVCNHKCPECFGYMNRLNNPITLNINFIKSIIEQISSFEGKAITFTGGGEPLVHPRICEAISYAHEQDLDVGIITNGGLLTKESCECITEHCKWIRISLDAGSAAQYTIRHGMPESEFKEVLHNISTLVKIKESMGSQVSIGAGYLTPGSMEDMEAFTIICQDLGVNYVQFRPLLIKYNQCDILYDESKSIESIQTLTDKYSSPEFNVLCSKHKYESITSNRAYGKCYGHHFTTAISADGKMYVCCHLKGIDKYALGDLNNSTIKEIWGSDQRLFAYDNIALSECPLHCRCDSFNKILWNIKQIRKDVNFL